MHICFITNEYPKSGFPHGGMGSFVKTIANQLVLNNVKVSVVGINYDATDEIENDNGVIVHRLKMSNIRGITWLLNSNKVNKKIKEIHQNNPIDIVESSELGLAFIKKTKNIKYIVRLHGGHHFFAEAEKRKINIWKGYQEKNSFKKADAFIAVSNFVKTHTEKYLSYNNKTIEIINNPINTKLFQPTQIKVVKHQITFAGTVCEKKGVRELIRAFGIVKEKFPEATLEIFGRDWHFFDGSSYIKLMENKEFPKLGRKADSIHFNGVIPFEEIPKKYAQSEVCVFPSHMETQGLVAPEAMAMEKIVVFSELGPGKETIIPFETGLLCNPYSPEDIAEKIIWVFNNNDRTIEIGKKARKFVENKYGLENIISKNIKFYKSIINYKVD